MAHCKKIPGFPGYKISVLGVVWSKKRGPWRRRKPSIYADGYKRVILKKDGRPHSKLIHRLVLETFVGPCPPGMECRHFPDRDKTNCRLTNLSWGTHLENVRDTKEHGTLVRGKTHGRCKLTEKVVREIRRLFKTTSVPTISKTLGIHPATVSNIANRRSWRHVK